MRLRNFPVFGISYSYKHVITLCNVDNDNSCRKIMNSCTQWIFTLGSYDVTISRLCVDVGVNIRHKRPGKNIGPCEGHEKDAVKNIISIYLFPLFRGTTSNWRIRCPKRGPLLLLDYRHERRYSCCQRRRVHWWVDWLKM